MVDKIKEEYTRLKYEVDTIILKPIIFDNKKIFIIKIVLPLVIPFLLMIIKPSWIYKKNKKEKVINYNKLSIYSILFIFLIYLILFNDVIIKKLKNRLLR